MNPKAFYCRRCGKASDGLTAQDVFDILARGKSAAYVAARSEQLHRLSSAIGRCACPDPAPAPVKMSTGREKIRRGSVTRREGSRRPVRPVNEAVQAVPAPPFHLLGLSRFFSLEKPVPARRSGDGGLWPLFAVWLGEKGC